LLTIPPLGVSYLVVPVFAEFSKREMFRVTVPIRTIYKNRHAILRENYVGLSRKTGMVASIPRETQLAKVPAKQ
jgi:hypothetical protein